MIVCNKVFSASTLARLSKSLEETPQKPRRELAREVCSWLNWVDHKGNFKISSCMKSFSTLHKKRILVFPKIEKEYTFSKEVAHEKRLILEPIESNNQIIVLHPSPSTSPLHNPSQ